MQKKYNSRQSKIYSDYQVFSSEKLLDILKNEDTYLPEVLEIVNDIIAERKDIPSFILKDLEKIKNREREDEERQSEREIAEQTVSEWKKKQEEVNKFLSQSEHYSDKELSEIITRYLYYEPGAVEAALIISEKRKIITPIEKENLLTQVEMGFMKKQKQDNAVKRTRQNFSRVEIIGGMLLLGIGAVLHFSGIHFNIFGTPVVFYGLIIGGIALIIDGIL